MPVRDLDDWLSGSERAIRPLSNRGANGIDGVVSTALGAAAAGVGPVVLVVGDVSFLHDLNALVSARLHDLSATIVLVDNDGGGIFSFLPQATTDAPEVGLPEHYEELFGTPHGIDPARPRGVDRPARRSRARVPDRPGSQRGAPSGGGRGRGRGPGAAMSGIVVDGLRWEVRSRGTGSPLLLVHGFTGRGTSWERHATAFARRRRVISVDMPGHGRSGIPSDPTRASVERTADDLAIILGRMRATPADVIGYSLGARVALRLAIAHPRVVRRLVLESPSAGLKTEPDRIARRVADGAMADLLERDGIEAFVDEWERQPVFASHRLLPVVTAARLRSERLRNRPAGLAASLRGAGQGAMTPLHARLGEVRAPTLVIVGALDAAGCARAEAVAAGIPDARFEVLAGAGHTPHLETPIAFRSLALAFLEEEPAA
jgi:2-succinyl-6-hydroxy-2,4-cyclohexadiene-1-carboxylate synthase